MCSEPEQQQGSPPDLWLNDHLHCSRLVVLHHQRIIDAQIFDMTATQHSLCRRQTHFEIGRPRQHRRAMQAMIVEEGIGIRSQGRFKLHRPER
jgi:hypothetical protein